MTTPAAEKLYLEQHLMHFNSCKIVVYNPNERPLHELPVIYGFNNGGSPGFYSAQLLSEKGEDLGGHLCSDEGYMRADLGILEGSAVYRHELFRKKYPNGYRMEFVPSNEIKNHYKIQNIFKLAQEKADKNELNLYEN